MSAGTAVFRFPMRDAEAIRLKARYWRIGRSEQTIQRWRLYGDRGGLDGASAP